jgi:hypothetical protein
VTSGKPHFQRKSFNFVSPISCYRVLQGPACAASHGPPVQSQRRASRKQRYVPAPESEKLVLLMKDIWICALRWAGALA